MDDTTNIPATDAPVVEETTEAPAVTEEVAPVAPVEEPAA